MLEDPQFFKKMLPHKKQISGEYWAKDHFSPNFLTDLSAKSLIHLKSKEAKIA